MIELTLAEQRSHRLARFASHCVELYKHAHGLSGAEAYLRLEGVGALCRLDELYDQWHDCGEIELLSRMEALVSGDAAARDATVSR